MKIPRPNRRVLAGAAALLVVAAAVVVGVQHSTTSAPTPAPPAAAAPAPVVQTSVECNIFGPIFAVTITPPPGHGVSFGVGERIQGQPYGQRGLGEFVIAPSQDASTTANFRLERRTGTMIMQEQDMPSREIPYDCPPLPGDPPGAQR